MKKHNFNAGPAILPPSVIKQASDGILDLNKSGMSILEISHRSKDFMAINDEAISLVKELYKVPEGYSVIFLTGGASTQFFMIPMSFLGEGETAAYTETGEWAKKAIKEAKSFGNVNVLESSSDKNFSYIPKGYTIPGNAKYFHITSNNTIFGTQVHQFPQSPVPMICDMSSDMLSRPIDVSKYAMIYAGAQKNAGPAGVTVVIMKNDFLANAQVKRMIPTMLNYKTHIDNNSLYNTPPVFSIFVCMLTFRWIKEQGGLVTVEKNNKAKAEKLYAEIDSNPLFEGTTAKEDRSLMNVTFVMKKKELEPEFAKFAKENGMIGIDGHRSVGGFRASLYNALPMESVDALVNVMREFAKKNV